MERVPYRGSDNPEPEQAHGGAFGQCGHGAITQDHPDNKQTYCIVCSVTEKI
jgi:hypothetical protein